MEKIINCKMEDLEDYYGLLGCDELSTSEQKFHSHSSSLGGYPRGLVDMAKEAWSMQEHSDLVAPIVSQQNDQCVPQEKISSQQKELISVIISVISSQTWSQWNQTEQIMAEYKVRALSCHPDKQPENPKAAQDFQKLQQAKDILTDETKRRKYDYWLRSSITVPFSEWQALSDTVKISMHWSLKSKKELMLKSTKDTDEFQAGQSETQVPKEGITSNELSSGGYWLHKFRRTDDTPSDLLEKFRNYQI
ncbi:hypothetical protein QTP70_032685 [Hemibagrus guttatus]|uniref:J domain-containing protein n=1 Tax=Hemibagrus guttatus TaxID=175788 RepID=A0AAE0RIE7_9TELE|nr:hypothetical protein QTP70_032685 [Hemibagrus guttatus]